MGDAVWFFHHAGTQLGPMTWSELKERAERGELDREDLVWQPELADWEPAGTVEGLFQIPDSAETAQTPSEAGAESKPRWKASGAKRQGTLLPAHLRAVDGTLRALGRTVPAQMLDRIDRIAESAAQVAYLGAAAFAMIALVVIAIRTPAPVLFVFALASIPGALLLAWVAARFLIAARNRLDGTESVFGSTVVLDGLAALVLCAGVLAVAVGLGLTVAGAGMIPLLVGLALVLVHIYAAAALTDAKAVNVNIREAASNTEETVASLAVLAKLIFLRMAPVVFAVAALAALFAAVGLLVMSIGEGSVPVWAAVAVWGRVLSVATIPVAAWFVFLLLWLPLGVAQSLMVPGGAESRNPNRDRE